MIRIVNTRTGSRVTATGGRDAANIIKIEQDRRSGIEATKERAIHAAARRKAEERAEALPAFRDLPV